VTSGLVADTGGLLRALACRQDGTPAWPDYTAALTQASAVIVPALVLSEVDYFLRQERPVFGQNALCLVGPVAPTMALRAPPRARWSLKALCHRLLAAEKSMLDYLPSDTSFGALPVVIVGDKGHTKDHAEEG
jgi:hypothetical protein